MGWTIAPGVHGISGGVISSGEIAHGPSGGASDGAGDGHGVAVRGGKGSVTLDCLCRATKVHNAEGGRLCHLVAYQFCNVLSTLMWNKNNTHRVVTWSFFS